MPPKVMTDPSWRPRAGELTWTRFDRSTARALGIVARLPAEPGDPAASALRTESVYCDMDLPDRYAIACLDGEESHVYVPRHYLKRFDVPAALALKCMKARASSLTPWDRDKRKAIQAALRWLELDEKVLGEKTALAARATKKPTKTRKEESAIRDVAALTSLPDVPPGPAPTAMHDFVNCPECCDEGADAFWAALRVARGDAHIRRKDSLERRRELIKEESAERDKLLEERALKAQRPAAEGSGAETGAESGASNPSDGSSNDPSSSSDDDSSSSSELSTLDAEDEDEEDDDDDDDEDVEMKPATTRRRRRAPRRKRRSAKPYLSSSSEETEAEDDDDHRKKRRKRT